MPSVGRIARPARMITTTAMSPGTVTSWIRRPSRCGGTSIADLGDLAVAELLLGLDRRVQQDVADRPRRPADGRHRADSLAEEDLGAIGVVDAGDDDRDPVAAFGGEGGDEVAVIARRGRDERVGAVDTCLLEDVAVVAEANDPLAGERWPQLVEGAGVAVDDGDRVAFSIEQVRDPAPEPAASEDDHAHRASGLPRAGGPRTYALRSSSAASAKTPNAAGTAQ